MNSEIFLIWFYSLFVFNLHSAWFPAFLDTLVIEVLTPVGSSVVALRLKNLFFTTFEEKDMDIIVEGKSLVLILLSASLNGILFWGYEVKNFSMGKRRYVP